MTLPESVPQLEISKPCPRRWSDLEGFGNRRFCSECRLHVVDGSQLTRGEAHALVAGSPTRVCMRLELGADGAPIHRDSLPARDRAPRAVRLARWALSAAAGLVAACTGRVPAASPTDPAAGAGASPPSRMGRVCAPALLGEAAVPEVRPVERLGDVKAPANGAK